MLTNKFRLSFLTTLLYCMLLLPETTKAFKQAGHFIIAAIAESIIIEKNRDLFFTMFDLLALRPDGFKTREGKYPIVECAAWADFMKDEGDKSKMDWHFINNYIDGENLIPDKDLTSMGLTPGKDQTNIVSSILNMIDSLRNFQNASEDELPNKAVDLRMLIHLIGDIHQPLHTTMLISNDFPAPKGDLGGNKFKIKVPNEENDPEKEFNLHKFWDIGLGQFDTKAFDDYSITDLNKHELDNYIEIVNNVTIEATAEQTFSLNDVANWANDSFNISLNNGYQEQLESGVKQKLVVNQTLTQNYISTGREIINKQLKLAGVRLAQTLLWIYDNQETSVSNDLEVHTEDVLLI